MEEWKGLHVGQLKRLVKGRAGRVAELQMEIKILEGIIEKKVREGDLGGARPRPKREARQERPGQEASQGPEKAAGEDADNPAKEQAALTKVKEKSSEHAFEEIE